MASYDELASLTSNTNWDEFRGKVEIAAAIKASAIIDSVTPTTVALEWAQRAIDNPRSAGDSVIWYVIAANANASVAQIFGATDAAIQTNVDAAVDALYP